MSSSIARSLLVGLVVVAALAVVVARRASPEAVTDSASARPSIDSRDPVIVADLPVEAAAAPAVRSGRWLNSEPLSPDRLAGKVVLYEFWTFGCVNCRNVLPYLKAWYDRYAPDGLVVVSIHTPEFGYEAEPDAVREFVKREHIAFPVALDPDKVTWRAFDNHYWPAFYLHDQHGRRRLTHFGEGAYDETEDAIRALLGIDPSGAIGGSVMTTVTALTAVFGAGILSFASPCVLPLVPVWAGLTLGAAPDRTSAVLRSTVPFVGGFAAVFVAFGALAGEAGGLVDAAGGWLPRLGGALIVFFGLALIGVAPPFARRDHRLVDPLLRRFAGDSSTARSAVAGVAFGAAWSPCVGPLLGSALVVAADSGSRASGALLLLAYALGVGTPLIVVSLVLASLPDLHRMFAGQSRRLRFVGGALLVVAGLAFAFGALERLVDPVARLLGSA